MHVERETIYFATTTPQ